MKHIIYISLIFLTSTSFAQGIEFFEGTWQEAIKQAELEDKIVFVDSYTTWCGPCKRMAANVFTQEKVGDFFNENFLNVKVDMEKGEGPAFGQKYPVSAYPTLFFLEPNGAIIQKIVGGKQAEQLLELGEMALTKFDFSADFREKYESGDRSYDLVLAYIEALNKSGKSSLKVANDYLYSNHQMSSQQKSKFVFAATTESDSRIFDMLIKDKKQITALVGQEEYDQKVLDACTKTAKKAILYENEALLKEAIDKCKSYANVNASVFETDQYLLFAESQNNTKDYIKYSKKKLKLTKEESDRWTWAKDAYTLFAKDTEVMNFAKKSMSKDANNSVKLDDIITYARILIALEEQETAIQYITESKKRITDTKTKKQLDSIINNLKAN